MDKYIFEDEDSHISWSETNIKDPEFLRYLEDHSEKDAVEQVLLELSRKNIKDLVVLNNLFVEKKSRGSGIGKKLLSEFLYKHKNSNVLLICDEFESQSTGIRLVSWYEKHGFFVLGKRAVSGPVMIKY
jgi:GNAT superfamily N-acetyltransferase